MNTVFASTVVATAVFGPPSVVVVAFPRQATSPAVNIPDGERLGLLLHDLAEEAAEQRWSDVGEHAGELLLSATRALRDGNIATAWKLAQIAGRALHSTMCVA